MHSARRVMVDNQIRTFDVTDTTVLAAFEDVPREVFVPEADQALAYTDKPFAVPTSGGVRPLLTPLVLARLIQAMAPKPGETALDVLGGMGYSAALMAAMGLRTSYLESDAGLVEGAAGRFAKAGVMVEVLPAQTALAADKAALAGRQFDLILVNGAVAVEPVALFAALAEGGRLGVIRRSGGLSQATIYLKSNGNTSGRRVFDAQAAVLPGFAKAPAFEF